MIQMSTQSIKNSNKTCSLFFSNTRNKRYGSAQCDCITLVDFLSFVERRNRNGQNVPLFTSNFSSVECGDCTVVETENGAGVDALAVDDLTDETWWILIKAELSPPSTPPSTLIRPRSQSQQNLCNHGRIFPLSSRSSLGKNSTEWSNLFTFPDRMALQNWEKQSFSGA